MQRHPDKRRQYSIKERGYEISNDEYHQMLEDQEGACGICNEEPEGRGLHIDHDHTTGKVRALLCHRCNTALGLLRESPSLLRTAADYLEEHSPHVVI
jgi:NAD-dependent dihydropyrimidine dehydrogenase PreA subunit